MDKLKPLIVHRFWIITSLSLILSLVGWSVGTGTLKKQYDETASKIDGAFSSLPDGKTTPNEIWIKNVEQANIKEQVALNRSAKTLWDEQQRLKHWPSDMQKEMNRYPYMSEDIPVKLARMYRTRYNGELMKLWKILDPFDLRDGSGTIQAHPSVIPRLPKFSAAPSAKVMWTSMEDIWLLEGLFRAIQSVNEGARTLSDSSIVQLKLVLLQGGTGTKLQAAGQGPGASEDGMGGAGGGEDQQDVEAVEAAGGGAGAGAGFGGAGFGGNLGKAVKVDIDLSKDVGSAALGAGGGGGGENPMGGAEVGGGGGEEVAGGGGAGGGMGTGLLGAGQQGKRYVDDDPDLKFKTRAFKLSFLMHVDKVPDLLAALNNIRWPVSILRVHLKSRSPDFGGGAGGLSGSSPAFGGAGEFGGAAGGFGAGAGAGGFGAGAGAGGFGAGAGGFGAGAGGFGAGAGGFGAGAGGFGAGAGRFGAGAGAGAGRFGAGSSPGTRTDEDPAEVQKARLEREKALQILSAAMSDPYLAEVVVTGLLTIYQPPDTQSEAEENADGFSANSTDFQSSSRSDDQSGQIPIESTGTEENATNNNPETENSRSLPVEPDGTSSESETQEKDSTREEPTADSSSIN